MEKYLPLVIGIFFPLFGIGLIASDIRARKRGWVVSISRSGNVSVKTWKVGIKDKHGFPYTGVFFIVFGLALMIITIYAFWPWY
jgi:hypothetical protein